MTLNIAIVGTGNVARSSYLPYLAKQPDVSLTYTSRSRGTLLIVVFFSILNSAHLIRYAAAAIFFTFDTWIDASFSIIPPFCFWLRAFT